LSVQITRISTACCRLSARCQDASRNVQVSTLGQPSDLKFEWQEAGADTAALMRLMSSNSAMSQRSGQQCSRTSKLIGKDNLENNSDSCSLLILLGFKCWWTCLCQNTVRTEGAEKSHVRLIAALHHFLNTQNKCQQNCNC